MLISYNVARVVRFFSHREHQVYCRANRKQRSWRKVPAVRQEKSTLRGTGLPGAELPMQDQTPMESRMDWARIEGNWKQVKGKVKEKWGKLTDDDLAVVNGRREQLEGKIQERYGYSRDQIRKDVDDWMKSTSW